MSSSPLDIAIIGAGPYGLSLAAHLAPSRRSVRIFGEPMSFWSKHMPAGMCLKSEGFASNLYDPAGEFPLERFCAERGIPYRHIGSPVRLEDFIAYGLAFQRRYVPHLEQIQITRLGGANGSGFELEAANGERLRARRVVIATGIAHFARIPTELAPLPPERVTHSSQHGEVARFKGRTVLVLGAGASALDVCVALLDAGASVELIARREAIAFHDPPVDPRPLLERIKAPRSGLGTGWRSRMCTDLPLVFHSMPRSLRHQAVARHLGPAPCWFVKDAVKDRLPMHVAMSLIGAEQRNDRVRLECLQRANGSRQFEADHLIAATGFKVSIARLPFLADSLRSQIRTADDTPILSRQFETSTPGLYFLGAAGANSFGPLLRFAYGAKFAARRLARHLASS